MIIITLLITLFAASSLADNLQMEISASAWLSDSTGAIESTRADGVQINIDLEKQLTMERSVVGQYEFNLRHEKPWAPNLKIGTTQLNKLEGNGRPLASSVINIFEDIFIPIEGYLDLTHYDLTLHWPVFETRSFFFDLGFTFRQFDGELAFEFDYLTFTYPIQADINSQYGFIYLSGHYLLPLQGLSIKLQSYLGHNFKEESTETGIDLDLLGQYQTQNGLGIGLGYRYMDVDLTSIIQGTKTNYALNVYGPYLKLTYQF